MKKKFFLFAVALCMVMSSFGGDLKKSVCIVRSDDMEMDSLYTRLGAVLQQNGYISAGRSLSKMSKSFGSGFVCKGLILPVSSRVYSRPRCRSRISRGSGPSVLCHGFSRASGVRFPTVRNSPSKTCGQPLGSRSPCSGIPVVQRNRMSRRSFGIG